MSTVNQPSTKGVCNKKVELQGFSGDVALRGNISANARTFARAHNVACIHCQLFWLDDFLRVVFFPFLRVSRTSWSVEPHFSTAFSILSIFPVKAIRTSLVFSLSGIVAANFAASNEEAIARGFQYPKKFQTFEDESHNYS